MAMHLASGGRRAWPPKRRHTQCRLASGGSAGVRDGISGKSVGEARNKSQPQARMQVARDDESRRSLAHETRAIHAPLANRLGIWQLKWPLEDLAFRYLEPEACARIERLVAEQRDERERYIDAFMQQLSEKLDGAGIAHEISGRAKHIYSIWRKMQRKGLDFHQLFDVRAVRVLVDDLASCYSALGLVHSHWQPVPGEFDCSKWRSGVE